MGVNFILKRIDLDMITVIQCECICGNNTFRIYRQLQVNGSDDTYIYECTKCGKEAGGNIDDEINGDEIGRCK
jgi:hypothetical protein